MSAASRAPRRRILAVVLVLAGFAAAFHVAHRQRLAIQPLQDDATRFFHITLLPRYYAQTHDGLWPTLDASAPPFSLPLAGLPGGYTIGPRFNAQTKEPVSAMLLGTLNQAPAYTLRPIDSIASECLYFGYAVTNESEFRALQNAIRNGAALDADIAVENGTGTNRSATLYRLNNRLFEQLRDPKRDEAEALPPIPALMEKPHDGQAWVFYLNGTLERLPYPGPFPACAAVVEGLR